MFALQSMGVEKVRNSHRLDRLTIALLLAGTAIPVHSATSTAATESASAGQPAQTDRQSQDIIVTGQLFRDTQPEYQLDQQAIESYGVSSVGDLLDEVQNELDDDQEPLILVNGERVSDVNEIGSFPVEALRAVQVLPRGSGVRVGGTTGQRVINLTLTRKLRSATVTAAPKIATEGDWHGARGEGLLTYIQGSTRGNLAFRVRDESSLLESDRRIVQPDLLTPYALSGNVVGFPDTTAEIDPLLSAAAGQTVFVAPVPNSGSPTLADFASAANSENVTDIGRFRTLWPSIRNYEFNGSFSTRLTPWLTGNANLKVTRGVSRSLRGLPSALFVLPATNASSPFSNDVGLAFYGQDPLHSRSVSDTADARITLNGRFGKWVSTLNVTHSDSKNVFTSERQTSFGTIILDDSINPFADELSDLIGITTDRSSSRTVNSLAQLSFTGPLLDLPAGPLQTTIEGRLNWYRLHSSSTFTPLANRTFDRNEQSVRGAIDVPLTSRTNGVLPQVGDLDATAEFARVHYSDAGSLNRYAFGLNWQPLDPLRLRAAIEGTDNPPSIQLLGNPATETPEVRVFDPLTGETVDVTQITGGNPALKPEKTTIRRVSALLQLVPKLNLQLNAEYTDTNSRNFISYLPPASLAVMLAFPERYIRDSSGELTTVDLRPVNFDSHREKRLRWGLSIRTKVGGGTLLTGSASPSPESESGEGAAQSSSPGGRGKPATYLQLTANHTVVFSDRLVIRPGLDNVDLLGGGALGIGGGRVRHQIDGTAAITSGGIGARLGLTWRGASTLDTSIGGVSDTLHFSPLAVFNLRLFADARRFLPRSDWAKGLRFSLDMVNLTNQRQRVRDSFGNTPLQYQPAYRDPLGRTIEFEIRKVF